MGERRMNLPRIDLQRMDCKTDAMAAADFTTDGFDNGMGLQRMDSHRMNHGLGGRPFENWWRKGWATI